MIEVFTIRQIHTIAAPVVARLLGPDGFVETRSLTWIRSADAPIRQAFALLQWKGGAIAPRWGLSLDFVPHVSAGRLKWHRTEKSADFDITIDSRDRDLDVSYVKGHEYFAKHCPSAIEDAVAKARQFYAAFASPSDLPAAISHMQSNLDGPGLGFDNYVQAPVAAAFAFAVNGRHEEADVQIRKFISRSDLDEEEASRLLALLESARRPAAN
jgi:hypothetical protein